MPGVDDLVDRLEAACDRMQRWLQRLPEWPQHPVTGDGSVSSHYGPTVLSEQDCVMHYARHLGEEGIPWEDMHFELGGSQWLFPKERLGVKKWTVDLAIVKRAELIEATLPDVDGAFAFDAFVEFKLASTYWEYGTKWRAPQRFIEDAQRDVEKVRRYIQAGVCALGYVIVVEEADASFPEDFISAQEHLHPGVAFANPAPLGVARRGARKTTRLSPLSRRRHHANVTEQAQQGGLREALRMGPGRP